MIAFGKALTAAALLVAAITLMVVADTDHHPELARWSILTAMFGCTMVVALVVDIVVHHAITVAMTDERKRTEAMLERVAARFAEGELDRHLRTVTRRDDL
jgi:uncharacterized membrane protein